MMAAIAAAFGPVNCSSSSTANLSTRDRPPPGNAQYSGKAGIDCALLPSNTSTPLEPSRVSINVADGLILREATLISTPSGTSLIGKAKHPDLQ